MASSDENDAITKAAFKVYPNPATSFVNISVPAANAKYTVKVYDVNGKAVIAQVSTQSNIQLTVSKIPAGNYFVRITNEDGKEVYNGRFTKQ